MVHYIEVLFHTFQKGTRKIGSLYRGSVPYISEGQAGDSCSLYQGLCYIEVHLIKVPLGEHGWRSGWAFVQSCSSVGHLYNHVAQLGFDSRIRCQMWVEFVVGFRPCSERFFSGCSGFPLSSKTNISKFQFDLEFEGHRFVSRIILLHVTLVK